MQYTAASFAQPLLAVFRAVLVPERHALLPAGTFPTALALEDHGRDPIDRFLLGPAIRGSALGFAFVRRATPSRVQWYVLAVFVALVVLLLWGIR
jgi:hypothetical protein